MFVQIVFQENLKKHDLSSLYQFLTHPNHKIVALDMSSKQFKESEILKVIKIFNQDDVDNSKIDVINFGTKKFYEK